MMTDNQIEDLAMEITKLFIPLDIPSTLGSINFAMKAAEVAELLAFLGTANGADGAQERAPEAIRKESLSLDLE